MAIRNGKEKGKGKAKGRSSRGRGHGRRIYLDYASITPIDQRVVGEMKKYSRNEYANPSALHKEGVAAKNALDEGRAKTAGFLNAHPDEIVFASGGTEANALAILGAATNARASATTKAEKGHVIISEIEHSSVISTTDRLKETGFEVTRIKVGEDGRISLEELKKAIRPDTILVSIMMVNNETGSLEPIREIAKTIRHFRRASGAADRIQPLFHTDASQAGLFFDLNVEKLGVDMLTLDGSKLYGPRGIGCLYIKRGTPVDPLWDGGGQEDGMRSGTENLPAIMGFAKALEIAKADNKGEKESNRILALRERMIKGLLKIGKKAGREIKVNGGSSPHILNVSISGIDNEFFMFQLDAMGIACSTRSSCLRDEDESYVLRAIGADSKSSIRFSFGRWTEKGDIDRVLLAISGVLC